MEKKNIVKDIINERVNMALERRMKSLTKYEYQFLVQVIGEWCKEYNTYPTPIQMIDLIKSVKKEKITKKKLDEINNPKSFQVHPDDEDLPF